MIDKDLYFKVLDCLHDNMFLAKKADIVQERDFQVIGDVIINLILEEIAEIDITQIKKIVCINLGYSQDQCSRLTYEELCVLICERVIGLKTYPADEYQQIKQDYDRIKNEYCSVIEEIDNKIRGIDELIKIDKENPQGCGDLIKKQKRIKSNNKKALLKDLKKIENQYNVLCDLIQEKYVYREMLKYAKEKLESYFEGTFFSDNEPYCIIVKKTSIELARSYSRENSILQVEFENYDQCLKSWNNAVQSIYKPFYLIKMRKFLDDIEAFYLNNCNGAYWNRNEELIEILRGKREKILDSDQWINLRTQDVDSYVSELKKHISEHQVVDYLKQTIDNLYCLKDRKTILNTIIDSFENQNYVVFMNLVVIQIEGLIYDMFVDANIQKRLDGDFDLFEKDDLKSKMEKNDTSMGLEEASLYFKFYFNNMIRNKVAHGRNCFKEEEYERVSLELLLDLQYVIHLFEKHSDTNEAVEYVKQTLQWLEYSFKGQCTDMQIYEKLLNSLNNNVYTRRNNFIGYVDSHQELYWIFNPYYEEAYEYAEVIELRDKLRDYLTNEGFWNYVLAYTQTYYDQEIPQIKLSQEFKSRVRAMQSYIAKNKREILPIVIEVSKTISTMQLNESD
ncbi:MAG: hypothetical protein UHK60_11960 [Acutalibacteraceae bacterium]|nr:hypothetical protein [Acutalibacteraceae bacterium]